MSENHVCEHARNLRRKDVSKHATRSTMAFCRAFVSQIRFEIHAHSVLCDMIENDVIGRKNFYIEFVRLVDKRRQSELIHFLIFSFCLN